MKAHCIPEDIIDTLHVLLHADDTIIISTSENSFIQKCNMMLNYFADNKLRLNLGKSGYIIIDGKGKCNKLLLNNGYLQY